MEDLLKAVMSYREVSEEFNEDDVRRVVELNYKLSKEFLENKLANARVLYNSSSRSLFSTFTLIFAGVAVAFTLFNVVLSWSIEDELIRLVAGFTTFAFAGYVAGFGYSFSKRFGIDQRESKIEMCVIPLMIEYKSRSKKYPKPS